MSNDLTGKYFCKTTENGAFTDITTLVNGVRILKIDGINAQGEPVNIYTAQWVDNQGEDFMITKTDALLNPVVVRKNVDIEITFIVSPRYASGIIDTLTQHDSFISQMTSKDIWIKSMYTNKEVHCVCLEQYEPTTTKLQRGNNSYMMGTLKLHTLDKVSTI